LPEHGQGLQGEVGLFGVGQHPERDGFAGGVFTGRLFRMEGDFEGFHV
jgi:hypothetical protein